jgi:hypothetical protein
MRLRIDIFSVLSARVLSVKVKTRIDSCLATAGFLVLGEFIASDLTMKPQSLFWRLEKLME